MSAESIQKAWDNMQSSGRVRKHGNLLTTVSHEVSHARFFLDKLYRELVSQFWNEVPTIYQDYIRNMLASDYNLNGPEGEELLQNEFQAYLLQEGLPTKLASVRKLFGAKLREHLKIQGPADESYCLGTQMQQIKPIKVLEHESGSFSGFYKFGAFCLYGGIMFDPYPKLFRDFTEGRHTLVFALNSAGGFVTSASSIAKEINVLKKNGVKVITRLNNDAFCGSACIPLFMLGDVRSAGPSAKFGFHSGSSIKTGKISGALGMDYYFQELIQRGMKPKALEELVSRGTFESTEFTILQGDSAFVERSGLVSEIKSDETFGAELIQIESD